MAKRTRNRKYRRRRRTRKPNPSIPEEIMYDILLMLPVKTLSRFKSVCKSWLSLISSRDFIETHLSKSTHDPHLTRHHLNLSQEIDTLFITCSVYSLLNESAVTKPVEIDLPKQNSDLSHFGVIGSSHGVVCLAVDTFDDGDDVFLWNPSTRTSRRLPKCGMEHLFPMYVFCYDEFNNDFKVFADLLIEDGSVLVYSSKHDRWRKIKNFKFTVMYKAVYANGAVHCVVSPLGGYGEVRLIISFDKNMKTHREVLQPNYGEGVYSWNLTTFGKSLSVLCGFEGAHADLWVLKNCDVEESWTKLFTIPYKDTLPSYKHLMPLCVSVNGQIILQLDSLVLFYDPNANTFEVLFDNRNEKHVNLYGEGIGKLDALTWVESLVSPHV